jgi:hypothetical protein
LSREALRCEFCGTELLLVRDGSAFQTSSASTCVQCGSPLGRGAWFCVMCGRVLPENKAKVMELQEKQRFLQDDIRKKSPELASAVADGEFVQYCYHGKGFCYAVTDTRLFAFVSIKRSPRYGLREAHWTRVAAIGDIERKSPGWSGEFGAEFEVQTLDGPLTFYFGSGQPEWLQAMRFHREVGRALSLHNMGQKDIRSMILSLKTD